MEIVKFRLDEGAVAPVRKNPGDAGWDLSSSEDCTIPVMGRKMVKTGVYIELPANMMCEVRSRSGLAGKNGVFVLNSPGTIDSGYRGECCVILMNLGDAPFTVKKGDRIAQLIPQFVPEVVFKPVETLEGSARGTAGFGSTGVQ